jgi:hypothetical protein
MTATYGFPVTLRFLFETTGAEFDDGAPVLHVLRHVREAFDQRYHVHLAVPAHVAPGSRDYPSLLDQLRLMQTLVDVGWRARGEAKGSDILDLDVTQISEHVEFSVVLAEGALWDATRTLEGLGTVGALRGPAGGSLLADTLAAFARVAEDVRTEHERHARRTHKTGMPRIAAKAPVVAPMRVDGVLGTLGQESSDEDEDSDDAMFDD